MRTLLSQFCESFDRIVRPLLDPLNAAAEVMNNASPDFPGKAVRAELLDLRHQIEGLVEKVADQQAYVLLFGPLKSGKSTLMNALAGTYVSEVSSLPAYPCMVYLSHSDERQFDVTRYSGRTERFSDPVALHMYINRAHVDLADRIRHAEERGEDFDPSLHFPDAIRKVDVRLPAGELEQSGAVLVDTPGLYSRMKFGYDRMTREFRDSASCAIFVVKSDNLFLEQVFEEFEDLLDLFSRIFLVVNLDTSKVDLSPDGSLVPSLEREDPLRLIDAFESLAMSAPLKAAAEDGRLRIYPVDLLQAAHGRLSPTAKETQVPAQSQANFDAFLSDLTEYLNSTDYLVAFLGDSLRRARTLLGDTDRILSHDQIELIREQATKLEEGRKDTQRRRQAVQRLVNHQWRQSFLDLDEKLAPTVRDRARKAAEDTERAIDQTIDRWFGSDASLQTLVEDELVPALRRHQDVLVEFVQSSLSEEVTSGTAGIMLPTDISADLYAAGIDLNAIGKECLSSLNGGTAARPIARPLHSNQIPVRRSLMDWLFMRSTARLRLRLFGDTENPSLRIPIDVKDRRIGKEGRDALRRELDIYKGRFFHETVQHVQRILVSRYGESAVDNMISALNERDLVLEAQLDNTVSSLMEHRKVLAHLATLQTTMERATGAISELAEQYVSAEPAMLIRPVDEVALGETEPDVTLQPVPPPSQQAPMEAAKSESTPGSKPATSA